MKKRVLNIEQFIAEDYRIECELESLVERAINESANTDELREIYKNVLLENFGTTKTDDLSFDQKRKYIQLVNEAASTVSTELNESLKEEYQEYFKETLESFGCKSIAELGEKKSDFFKKLKEGWTKGSGRKVNENILLEKDITTDEQFAEFVKAKYKKAFGEDYDEKKAQAVIDGLLKKKKSDDLDYGALVGMVNKG